MEGTAEKACEAAPAPEVGAEGWEWAIVEVFGHRRHAGPTRQEERFGTKMLRIDIPVKGDAAVNGWETVFYGGPAIFSFAFCTEAAALQANKPYERPARYALPTPVHDDCDQGDEPEDDEPF